MPWIRDGLWQGRQNTVACFDQDDLDVLIRIDPVEAEGDKFPRCAMQFGGKFGASRASPDDRDMQLAWPDGPRLCVGMDAGIHEPAVETHGLFRGFKRDGVLRNSGGAEIIRDAPYCDDQR